MMKREGSNGDGPPMSAVRLEERYALVVTRGETITERTFTDELEARMALCDELTALVAAG